MRPVNLLFLSGIANEKLFSDYENILSGRDALTRIRRADQTALRSLVKTLRKNGLEDISLLDGFFFSFVIQHIGKEFDLLKVRSGGGAVLNIELKSQEIEEGRIEKQLLQNRYYLKTISETIYSFTYVSSARHFYTLDKAGKLRKCGPAELLSALKAFPVHETEDLARYFHTADYIISPISSPERFLARKYFLTNQQLFYRNEIMDAVSAKKEGEALFLGITGDSGTGKTLLLYDLALLLSESRRVLLIHGAALTEGQLILKESLPGIVLMPIRDVTEAFLRENAFDAILADECQRLYQVGFDSIVSHAITRGICCVFSFDPMQILTVSEQERDVSGQISLLCGEKIFRLSAKLRTNPEAAAFLENLFHLRKRRAPRRFRYDNITLLRAASREEEAGLTAWFEEKGYVYCGMSNLRDIIGQEYDKVIVTIDRNFFYDAGGTLCARPLPGSTWMPEKVLYQNIARCREKLCVIVTENDRMFRKICSILMPPKY